METGDRNVLAIYKELSNKLKNDTRELLHQEQKTIAETSKMNLHKILEP